MNTLSYIEIVGMMITIITILSTIFFTFYLFSNGKKDKVTQHFIIINILLFLWCVGLILEELTIRQEELLKWIALSIEYFGSIFLAYNWLVFCLYFSGIKIVSNTRFRFLIAVPQIFVYVALITNRFHYLFYIFPENSRRYFGPMYYILIVVSIVYYLVGSIILLKYYIKSKNSNKIHSRFIIITFMIIFPIVLLRVVLKWDVEIIPMICVLLIYFMYTIGLNKLNLFNVIPISTNSFLDLFNQGICIVDKNNNFILTNKKFQNTFGFDNLANQNLLKIFSNIDNKSFDYEYFKEKIIQNDFNFDMKIELKEKTNFNINNQIIEKNDKYYKIINFTDITNLTDLNDSLASKNIEIEKINAEFKDINDSIVQFVYKKQELAKTIERNRLLSDLYSKIKVEFKEILKYCDLLLISYDIEEFDKINNICRNGLNDIRSIIHLERDREDIHNLDNLTIEFETNGINISATLEGNIQNINHKLRYVMYCIWKQTLSNSITHGKASSICTIIKVENDILEFYIIDNGIGCEEFIYGNGLKELQELAHENFGEFSCGSLGINEGFSVLCNFKLDVNNKF